MKLCNIPAAVRWPVALVSFSGTAWFLNSIAQTKGVEEEYGNAALTCLFCLLSLVAGTFLIGPELARMAAAPLNHLLENALFPTYSEDPPVDFRLARRYRAEGRYEEAIQQYFHILEYHPQELFAYLEGMETAFEGASPKIARLFYRKGLRHLSSPEARTQVKRIFASLATGD